MSRLIKKEINIGQGRLITAQDPITIGTNYRTQINLRPNKTTFKGVGGMTKVNTTALSTQLKTRGAFHYEKDYPTAESHVIAQAWNAGDTAFDVVENTTAIGSQGNFSATKLLTDSDTTTSGAGRGRFSYAPNGQMAYADGVNTYIWGGTEVPISKFINFSPTNAFRYDWTERITNSDSSRLATLYDDGAGNDSATEVLHHFDNSGLDSSSDSDHDLSLVGNAAYSTTKFKFGTHSLYLDGTGDWATMADGADFNFAGGIWTIDCWINLDNLTTEAGIYSQATSAAITDYMYIYVHTDGSVKLLIQAAGAPVVSVTTPASVISATTWHHIAVVENLDNYYIFVDGIQQGYGSDANRAADYNSLVYIGVCHDGTNDNYPFQGYIDELRLSFSSARWESNFTPPIVSYDTDNVIYAYLGVTRPIDKIKWYVNTSLGVTSSPVMYYWSGTNWTTVGTITDTTAAGGVTLSTTGTWSFSSTATSAKPSVIDDFVLYWYRIEISATSYLDAGKINQVTVSKPFQAVKDLWDGEYRICDKFLIYTTSYTDNTNNVYKDETLVYDAGNAATYADVGGLTSSQYVLAASFEQSMGIFVEVPVANTTALTLSVYYSADGSNWTSAGTITDGTSANGISLSKSGIISWASFISTTEFQQTINGSDPLYYYKLQWNGTISAGTRIAQVQFITAPKTISSYRFPFYADNSLFLCSDQKGEKHKVLKSAPFQPEVFNGNDSVELYFGNGEELTAACNLYSQKGSNIYDLKLFFTESSTWGLSGSDVDSYKPYQISSSIGCVAPNTLQTTVITTDKGSVPVAIFEAKDGIYMFDNTSPRKISIDIDNFFDKNETNARKINASYRNLHYSFIDETHQEYHWCFADGSSTGTLNREFAFKLDEQKWYEIDRGTGKYLQCAVKTQDTNGNPYIYGFIDTGYMEQLETGTTFDGTDITHTLQFGDFTASQEGSIWNLSQFIRHKMYMVGKSVTANEVAVTHYGDTNSTGTSLTAVDPTPQTNHRIAPVVHDYDVEPVNIGNSSVSDYAIWHSLKYVMTTNDETVGFEPVYVALEFNEIGEER